MGFSCGAVELIIQEHLHKPLTGDILLIGRQNTDIPPQAMLNLLDLYGITPRVPLELEKRGSLAHNVLTLSDDTDRIADVAVFHSLADVNVMALDISDYEGAEIVHDLNLPLPDKYKGRFDFIFDGSSMDNIFNGAQALFSFSELLRPGGRVLAYNASNSARTAYSMYSPDWFFDFFAANRYADCKLYLHEFPFEGAAVVPAVMPKGGYPPQHGTFWHYDPLVVRDGKPDVEYSQIWDSCHRYVYALAEKGSESTSAVAPVKKHLRGGDANIYVESALRFRNSGRPVCHPRSGESFSVDSISKAGVVYPVSRWSSRPYEKRPNTARRNESPPKIPVLGSFARA